MECNVLCKKCRASFTITFKNQKESPGLYAMAIDNKLQEGCPDCGGRLVVDEE